MNTTYKLIIKKILNTENNVFSFNYDKTDTVDEICKLLFYIFLKEDINTKSKFLFFSDCLNNVFLKGKQTMFIDYFCKIQKTYKALNRLIYNYKYNKSNIVVNTDMALNEINETHKTVLCILHKKSRYLFTANDIINIINASLTNNYLFFSQPLCIKNPYNNLPFLKSTLYNIYLFIKYNTTLSPELFFYYFKCDFNLTIFKNKHEYLLREYSIINYVYKSPPNTIVKDIRTMIDQFNNNCKIMRLKNEIFIDKEFPSNKLIKIMTPYLLIYVVSKYSLLSYKKLEAQNMLRFFLVRFNNYNPQFGRKKFKILMKYNKNFKKRIVGKIIEFDEKHIAFHNIEKQTETFLEDHLIYNENTYYSNEYDEDVGDDIEDEDEDEDGVDSIS